MRYLSLTLTLVVSIQLLTTTCRKNKELELEEYYDQSFADSLCYNDIMDANELGEDCGGPCEPCMEFDLPCEPESNIIDIEVYSPWPVVEIEVDTLVGNWVFKAFTVDGGHFRFTFSGRPDIAQVHTLDSTPYHLGEVDIDWVTETGTVKNVVGLMYPSYVDGHYVFEACGANVILSDDVASPVNFNITF